MSGFINPSGKVLRHPERLTALKQGKLFAPIGVEIDLSNRCNLGCAFCHFSYTHSRGPLARKDDPRYDDMGDLIAFSLLKRALGEMKTFGVESVTYTGGGEPTLHPRFIECLEAAHDCGLQIGLYTNATLIDDAKAEAIKQYCSWVVVSLDEAHRDRYLKVKQVDAFDKACDGVRRLVAAKGKAVVGLSYLVRAEWDAYFADAQRLGIELGADYIEYRPTVLYDEDDPAEVLPTNRWILKALPALRELATQPKTDVRLEQFELYLNYRRNYQTCYGVLFTGIITPNGYVWKCVNRRGYPDSFIGDLNQEGFAQVWAKQKPHTDFAKCRVLCRADVMNRQLWKLAQPIPHESFV